MIRGDFMIHVTIFQNHRGDYTAFSCVGHAGYAEAGEDIVCAAASVLAINTVNAVEQLVGDRFSLVTDEESGRLEFSLKEHYSGKSVLLIQALVLGLQGIQESYGNEYLSLNFKEV